MEKQLLISELKESLNSTPLLKLWNDNLFFYDNMDEIIAVRLVGSRALKLDDENSDIDIQIFTTKIDRFRLEYAGTFKGINVHWWFLPISFTWGHSVSFQKYDRLLYGGIATYIDSVKEDFIYINPKYQAVVNSFLNHIDTYFYGGMHALYEVTKNDVSIFLETKEVFNKIFWYYSYYYYKLKNLPLNKDFILKIKRQKASIEEINTFIEQLQFVINFLDNDNRNWKREWLNASLDLEEQIKAIKEKEGK